MSVISSAPYSEEGVSSDEVMEVNSEGASKELTRHDCDVRCYSSEKKAGHYKMYDSKEAMIGIEKEEDWRLKQ